MENTPTWQLAQHGMSYSKSKPSCAVVEAVADREDVDPGTLKPPLYTVIDTEALDAIFASTPGDSRSSEGTGPSSTASI